MKVNQLHSVVFIILDGWGYCNAPKANAIAQAKHPTWEKLWTNVPHTLLACSGPAVGLPQGQIGNSEVGHLHMGAGRLVSQGLARIDSEIAVGAFSKNNTLIETINKAKASHRPIHLMGLFSNGGVHSHERHFYALLKFMRKMHCSNLFIHAFLDGRDTPPKSALASLRTLEDYCNKHQSIKIGSIIGRYYAMDRDHHWERTQKAYELLVNAKAVYHAENVENALLAAYARGESDEFVQATCIHEKNTAPHTIQNGDSIIFMNFRADRARQLTQAFTEQTFTGFKRYTKLELNTFMCFSEYDANYKKPVLFPPIALEKTLCDHLSACGLKQLKIAETEKYAHVTFFFNGGREDPYPNEDRILIPSPKIATYDLQPEMSANTLTEKLLEAIASKQYALIVCNFANPDMVAHTGNFKATIAAIETIDQCLERIYASVQQHGTELIISADHGNAEQLFDHETKQAHTAHTTNPVPFIYVGRSATITTKFGRLSDIAPTILYLLDLPIPKEMTGKSLLQLNID